MESVYYQQIKRGKLTPEELAAKKIPEEKKILCFVLCYKNDVLTLDEIPQPYRDEVERRLKDEGWLDEE